MIIPIKCKTCINVPHTDHYECSKCEAILGGAIKYNSQWNFCPFCGEPLSGKKKKVSIKKYKGVRAVSM